MIATIKSTRFCIKSNRTKSETLPALESLLSVDSNFLEFGYGYIYQSNLIANFVEKIVEWLQQSPDRNVMFYVGIIPDPKLPLKKALAEASVPVLAHLRKLFPEKLYASGTTDRISVAAIAGFHCKFALACNDDGDGNLAPVAGLFGSTNLSHSALAGDNRFELDLLIGSDSPLLNDFSNAVRVIIDEATKSSELLEIGESIYRQMHRDPWERDAIEEAINAAAEDDLFDRVYHTNESLDENERAAQIDSDAKQGIHSKWPSRKDKR